MTEPDPYRMKDFADAAYYEPELFDGGWVFWGCESPRFWGEYGWCPWPFFELLEGYTRLVERPDGMSHPGSFKVYPSWEAAKAAGIAALNRLDPEEVVPWPESE